MAQKGYIHIYTGNGKGKTTAAFGLAVRMLCADKRVYIGQFVKSMKYHETRIEEIFEGVRIEQYGRGCFLDHHPDQQDIAQAKAGLARIGEVLRSGAYDLVVLDEVTIALYFGLLSEDEVLAVLDARHERVEVVLTGRYASQRLIDRADLVTQMQEVKHYYQQGVEARDGIER